MKLKIHTKRYIKCPKCQQGEFEVEHLFAIERNDFGPWYCDECGISFDGTITADGEIDFTFSDSIRIPAKILLQVEPQKESIFFMLDGSIYRDHHETEEDINQFLRYFYEEHTCPTNWLKDVCEVKIGDDTDPHGLATFEGYRIVNKSKQVTFVKDELD